MPPYPAGDDAWRELHGTLVAVFAGDASTELERLRALAATASGQPDRALLEAACAMAAIIACAFDDAAAHAARSADAASSADAAVVRVARAVLLMCDAMAGSDHARERGIDLATECRTLDRADAARDGLLTRYLLAEAALSSGAFDEFAGLMDAPGLPARMAVRPDVALDGAALTLHLLQARALAFRGRGAEAAQLRAALEVVGGSVPGRALTVLRAIECYAASQAGDRERFDALADLVLARSRRAVNYLSVGSCIYVVWGLRASGQLQRSAALLTAIGGEHLERCKIWDRALGFELLVEAALERRDHPRATAIMVDVAALARYSIAAAPVARTIGALASASGRVEEALEHALAAVRMDEAAGATAEAHRSRILQAAVVAASDPREAAALLHQVAEEADAVGNESIRLSAARRWHEQRDAVGGLVGTLAIMTARQRQVVSLVAEGHSNAVIAQALFLSPRTVQSHVAEILRISGTRTRAQAVARLSPRGGDDVTHLSARQREIGELIAAGLRNREIAERLGLSEKTVEHHVSALLAKLGVAARSGVAALMSAR